MINYLSRLRSPLPHFFYYSGVTEGGNEARLVAALAERPPEWVLFWPHDLREYGIGTYGERVGAGAELLAWVRANYQEAASGAEPMFRPGVVNLFRRKRR